MTFDEILDRVITLLQRQGRVSYPALKRRFALDDNYLEDLKTELFYVHPVVDDDGKGLLWTGEADSQPASSSTPLAQQEAIQQDPSTPEAPRPTEPPSPDAERRQLTVMFIDLVESTSLSSQLDPEDLREVVRAYQHVCSEVITRFDGHIAQLLGDGLLVYFGYPQAHEDDAQRAVRAGLGILDVMRELSTRLQQDKGIHLGVRLGIHTGLVVIGEMGGAGRQEQLALGEVPNVCSRIQGLAASNTLVVSEATYRLIQGYFECEDLGSQALRGVTESMHIYQVLGESGATSRLDVAQPRGLTPLVGREQEVGLLVERWEQVKAGHGHVVLLTGDAGIGKSRLVQMLKEHVDNEPHVRWECRSLPYYQNTALYPLTDLFQRILQWQHDETPDEKFSKLEHALSQYRLPLEESVALFAPLLSLPLPEHHYPPLNLSPQRQRQKTLEAIIAILLELAERQPVLFIVEDLHWTDPTTLELLGLLLDQTPTASMLVLLTCRSHFQPSWSHRSYLSEVTVNRLSQPQIERMTTHVAGGKPLPTQVLAQITEKTDGVPLFVEEITKAVLESGALQDSNGQYTMTGILSSFTIPATLQDSLMARLDHLITAKSVAQYAAVIGRQFSYDLLHAVSQVNEAMLQNELGKLVEAEIVYQRGVPPQATYVFKHALIQDAAYESLLKSTRQHYHQRIAQVLDAQFPETAEAEPELLAHHYMEAGLTNQSAPYWYKAAQHAVERSAHVEAISHLRQGLALLQTLPETPERTQQALPLHIALGVSLAAIKSYAASEVQQTYTRAHQLCQHLDNPPQLFLVLRGLWNCHHVRAEHQTAYERGEQFLALARHVQDAAMLMAAYRSLGSTLFMRGAVAAAHTHFAQGITLYDPQQHRAAAFRYGEDAGVLCQIYAALALWYLGYPEQGRMRLDDALILAQQSSHAFSLGFTLSMAAIFHQLRREVCCTQERAEAAISLATEQGFPHWRAMGCLLRGWALTHQRQAQEGIEQITTSMMDYHATGAALLRPYFLGLLTETHSVIGQPDAGLTVLREALTLVDTTGERWCEPELYRLKGELLLQQTSDRQAEAENCFHHALEIARNQQAKSFELRAATSLARLWHQQDKRQAAHDLLAPVYNWFTEGFDTADLKDAQALLEVLEERS